MTSIVGPEAGLVFANGPGLAEGCAQAHGSTIIANPLISIIDMNQELKTAHQDQLKTVARFNAMDEAAFGALVDQGQFIRIEEGHLLSRVWRTVMTRRGSSVRRKQQMTTINMRVVLWESRCFLFSLISL